MGKLSPALKSVWCVMKVCIIIATVVGCIKGVFISLDIDESYAVAQSYRLASGDRMFVDMWEPHQLSAFLGAIFIKPYIFLFHTTDYLIIFLRIIGIAIHTGVGALLYRNVKNDINARVAFWIFILHLNFLPKWLQTLEFEVMHYWFMVMIYLLLSQYFLEKRTWWRATLAGACLVGSMMSYPTMILVYPVYLIGLCVLERNRYAAKGKDMLKSAVAFTCGAVVTGILFLCYLICYQSIGELFTNISYVFLDESHTVYTFAEKWSMYGTEFGKIWDIYFSRFLQATILFFPCWVGYKFFAKEIKKDWKGQVETCFLCVLLLTAVLLHMEFVWDCLFEDKNQFYLQVRYIAVVIPGLYYGILHYNRLYKYVYLCIFPSIITLFAVLSVSNMDINVAFSKLFLGVLGSVLVIFDWVRQREDSKVRKCFSYILVLSVLAGLLVCKLVLIRVTGCLPVTIKAPLEKVEMGPEKGICILSQQAEIWNDNYAELEKYVCEEDNLLYIGAENLIYPATQCGVSTPSTQGTTVFNEIFPLYFETHADKLPNVVVIDKTMQQNVVYELFSDTSVVLEWVEKNFANAIRIETNHMTILRLE